MTFSQPYSLPSCLTIATRGSKLAVWQSNYIKNLILAQHPKIDIKLLTITTKGDKITNLPLAKIGGKGLFVKEIEDAILNGQADLAVHSMKDLPMHLPPGLIIGAMPERGEAQDIYLSQNYPTPQHLPKGAVVGSSSLRRQAQMLINFPHLAVKSLRGNINTRLDKLARGEYDAIVLAAVGLQRLNLSCPHMLALPVNTYVPAAGQGALGVEFKQERGDLKNLLAFMNHPPTRLCVEAERAFLRELNGGCHAPIAAYASFDKPDASNKITMRLTGFIAADDGNPHVYHSLELKFENTPATCAEQGQAQQLQAIQLVQAIKLGTTLAQQIREMAKNIGLNY